jgi:hypothetical protein
MMVTADGTSGPNAVARDAASRTLASTAAITLFFYEIIPRRTA